MTIAEVYLWNTRIGAVALSAEESVAHFEYSSEFLQSGIEISPIMMPVTNKVYSFPSLSYDSFAGLPGMLADSLPDSFGQALINVWLAKQGRAENSMNAVERLCYTGERGMGALEFKPVYDNSLNKKQVIYIDSLTELASEIMKNRENISLHFSKSDHENSKAFSQILQIGTSAGGARAKAIIALNEKTNEVRSGQIKAGKGFRYFILKFDGIDSNRDKEEIDGDGYTNIEYAYYLMSRDAGIIMSESRLLSDKNRKHFITKRFDRDDNGNKLHMQTLGGLAHYDFKMAGAYSYEQAFGVIRKLNLGYEAVEQMFRRMVFNVCAVNNDDHVKNISFLMNKKGIWSLAPAYDMTYSYNENGMWTNQHQMSINGKRRHITREDILLCGYSAGIKRADAKNTMEDIEKAVGKWTDFANQAAVSNTNITKIQNSINENGIQAD